MKYTTAEIEKHINFVNGYMDAVGRIFTTEKFLFSLWAEQRSERLEKSPGLNITGQETMPDFVRELEQQVSEFFDSDPRERLLFYLLEYLVWFREFTDYFECYKIQVEFDPENRKYLAYRFVVNGSQEIYIFMTRMSKENA